MAELLEEGEIEDGELEGVYVEEPGPTDRQTDQQVLFCVCLLFEKRE